MGQCGELCAKTLCIDRQQQAMRQYGMAFDDACYGLGGRLLSQNHDASNSLCLQDHHALQSFERAQAALHSGVLETEVVPVEVPGKRGQTSSIVRQDEALGKMDPDKLLQLKPVFQSAQEGGTITAGNASPLSDGAAALVRSILQANTLL